MNDSLKAGMAEATRLTREGRLAEATAVIQRTLGRKFALATDDRGGSDEPIETTSRVVNEPPRPTSPSLPGSTEHTLRRAPRPPPLFRGATRALDGLTGTMPTDRADILVPDSGSAGERFVERSYSNRAGTRAYKLYIPSGYVGQAVPLVVMLHGCTQSPDDLAIGTRMNLRAEEHTFLVAYPAQAASANTSRCWN